MDKFKFGQNWNNYINKYLSEDKINKAMQSLQQFTGLTNFEDKTFVDIADDKFLFRKK